MRFDRVLSPRAAQVCDWFRLAKLRPHDGHVHMSVTGAAPRSGQPSQPRPVAFGQGDDVAVAGQDAGVPVPGGSVRTGHDAGRLAGQPGGAEAADGAGELLPLPAGRYHSAEVW